MNSDRPPRPPVDDRRPNREHGGTEVKTETIGTGVRNAVLLPGHPPGVLENTDPVAPVKPVIVSAVPEGSVDPRVVARQFFNRLNLCAVPGTGGRMSGVIGITSVHPREGKTLVACNLAVALSTASRSRTVLMDFNTADPRVHRVFGVPLRPGLLDALDDDAIRLSSSRIDRLALLPAGGYGSDGIGLGDLDRLGDIMQSLKARFRFVLVDMPSIALEATSESIVNHLDGVILVVDTRRTTRREVDRAFRRLPGELVLGFIFNRVHEDDF